MNEDLNKMLESMGLTKEQFEELQALAKKSTFVRKNWAIVAEYTVEQAALFYPYLRFMSKERAPKIVKKTKKDGKSTFLKMEIPLTGMSAIEFELSYEQQGYREGDCIDPQTLRICTEESPFGEKHMFATGEII